MQLSDSVAALGLTLKRTSHDVEVRIGMEGSQGSVEVMHASESRDMRGNRILRLDIDPRSLPTLIPRPRPDEHWYNRWFDSLKVTAGSV